MNALPAAMVDKMAQAAFASRAFSDLATVFQVSSGPGKGNMFPFGLDCMFGVVLGLGVGSFNAKKGLQDCLDGSLQLSKKKAIEAKTAAAPHVARAGEAAIPYVKQLSNSVKDRATQLRTQAATGK